MKAINELAKIPLEDGYAPNVTVSVYTLPYYLDKWNMTGKRFKFRVRLAVGKRGQPLSVQSFRLYKTEKGAERAARLFLRRLKKANYEA